MMSEVFQVSRQSPQDGLIVRDTESQMSMSVQATIPTTNISESKKDQCLHNLHSLCKNTKNKLACLRVKITQATSDSVDEEM